MIEPAIYQGHVVHVRPGKHRLRYRVFMLALDLDELPHLDRRLRLFAHNRPSLLSLYDRDHAHRRPQPLRPQIETLLRGAGLAWDGGRIVLLTMPRVLNYAFNPLSVYFCYGRDGAVAAIVHEVSNTFGERHFYVLPAREREGRVRQACNKTFFVSPFLEQVLRYEFNIRLPADQVSVAITARRGAETALKASFTGQYRSLNDASILCAWAGNPLMTIKVIAGIHYEALRMLSKGVRYLGRQGASSPAVRGSR